ncbi:MAG: N-6 DNA methylase [Verrucomicrobia bacterium]|nr:N-6 DNA methylase [Verrucomicrobiota bacterium]
MPMLALKPTHKSVSAYYDSLAKFARLGIKHETAVRSAFQELLEACARQFDWKLVPEYRIKRKGQADASADGALLDNYGLNHGLWEAKDSDDDLDKEIKHKFSIGYPRQNILFWQPDRAVLYQNSERFYEADLTRADDLVHVLKLFLEFAPPAIAEWEKAVEEFRDKVPQIGARLKELIETERQTNRKFIAEFEGFCSLCRGSLNPNISVEAVEEMIIQHILTERIFRKIFAVADFISRNVIAQEIEKVITALNSRVFSRDDFSRSLEHFYGAIENAAATITDFTEKQTFLNTVYERFFQGFCVKVADTHGIVYTPQPLVGFMVASVEQVLREEFGKSLADKDVHILDPFTGTGNYVVNIMQRIPKAALPHKFAHELHCNEIMLLPYYVASMNIEHAYYEATGKYAPFEGICLVDTFQTINGKMSYHGFSERHEQQDMGIMFNPENTKRINRQRAAPIRVVIANPPYNAGQVNENDNNKNRKYPELDRRVSTTYGEASDATLLRKLSDPYVKAIRYATDRIGGSGIVCFVNNNSFVTENTFDGMRKELAKDFDLIYVLDLGGNVRKNPKLSGTTHNVFGIQVGVSINLFVRRAKTDYSKSRGATIRYHAVGADWRKEEKYAFLEKSGSVAGVKWKKLTPDKKGNWITNDTDEEFDTLLPIGSREAKAGTSVPTIFRTYSLGVSTNRDAVAYDFDAKRLAKRVEQFAEDYNAELHRWQKKGRPADVDNFVSYEKIKWSRDLKLKLEREIEISIAAKHICEAIYRPFTKLKLYGENPVVDREGTIQFFRAKKSLQENRVISLSDVGLRSPFSCLVTSFPSDLHLCASTDGFQNFPLFTYSEDGKERRDNVLLPALTRFQIFYGDDDITRADLFHYVYAVLHHPAYRKRFAENLKRELPRIPLIAADGSLHAPLQPGETRKVSKKDARVFHAFAAAGKKLADLHVNYESAKEFPLKRVENKEVPLDWRVEAMKLTKDKSAILYNDFLTLEGIPPEVFDYRLGNRSALDWVIDQYRVTRDETGNIASDPNRMDDEEYIVRLLGQVITVSLETQKVVKELPELKF